MLTSIERRLRKIEAAHLARDVEFHGMTDDELFAVLREIDPGQETETFIRWYQTGEAPAGFRPIAHCAWATDYTNAQLTRIAREAGA